MLVSRGEAKFLCHRFQAQAPCPFRRGQKLEEVASFMALPRLRQAQLVFPIRGATNQTRMVFRNFANFRN